MNLFKKMVFVCLLLLAVTSVSGYADTVISTIYLTPDRDETYSSGALVYYSYGTCENNSVEGHGKVRLRLQTSVDREWENLENVVVAEGKYAETGDWGRAECDTWYTHRIKVKAVWNVMYGNHGRSAVGQHSKSY